LGRRLTSRDRMQSLRPHETDLKNLKKKGKRGIMVDLESGYGLRTIQGKRRGEVLLKMRKKVLKRGK